VCKYSKVLYEFYGKFRGYKVKILITGGAGFIGSHIAEHFKDDEVIVYDNLRTGFKKNIENLNVKFVKASVTDYKTLNKWMKGMDYVFHLAALISVPESLLKPVETEEINTQGTLNVLKSARVNKVKKVIYSSSAAVYGDNPILPKKEDMLPEPKSPYAVSKLSGEYYCRIYSEQFNLPTAVLRYFNVFGPRQDPNSQYAAVIPIFIKRALKNEDIIIFGDGEQTRDFIYVKEVVKANILAMEKGDKIYNVASGGKITINELAEKIIKLTNSKSKIVYTDKRPGDIKHSCADISQIKSIGFEPEFNFDEALKITIEYFRGIYS